MTSGREHELDLFGKLYPLPSKDTIQLMRTKNVYDKVNHSKGPALHKLIALVK